MLNIGDRYTNKFGEQFEIIKKTSFYRSLFL